MSWKPGVLLVLLVFVGGLASSTVEIGPGARIFQSFEGSELNFSQGNNFSFVGVRGSETEFNSSNFSVSPESQVGVELDFYDTGAGRQKFVSNFSVSASSSQEVNFSVGNLPSNDFYEAFETGTGSRIFIGYTDSEDRFNFSTQEQVENVSVLNYGEKGIFLENVVFNNSDPTEFDSVGVGVNTTNEGVVDPENANISLVIETYNGSEWVEKDFRSSNFTVPENSSQLSNFTWGAKPGPWRFNFEADPENQIKETNETNNNESSIYNVPSYNIFYGGSDTQLNLGAGSENIYNWNPATERGNLFFSDIDSAYSFTDLEPVESGSFQTIDDHLNMTGHNDSIKEEWDSNSDGVADQNKTYTIGQRNLDVPVSNSTAGGPWKTGILYDSADGSPYDGSQDLIFITEINDSTDGKYGNYDYESKIPSSLRDLKPGSSEIEIIVEVK